MKFVLQATDAKAEVWGPNENGMWSYAASYSDGSGKTQDWAPTKRGAMMRAINEYRWKAHNYRPAKFKWVQVES